MNTMRKIFPLNKLITERAGLRLPKAVEGKKKLQAIGQTNYMVSPGRANIYAALKIMRGVVLDNDVSARNKRLKYG